MKMCGCKFRALFLSIIQAVLVGLTSGCKVEGTGTGNPMQPATSPIGAIITATESIAFRTCTLTAHCHSSASVPQCMNSVASLTSYAPKLGFPVESPLTMWEIRELELKKIIHPNVGDLKKCLAAISATSCECPEAVGSYLPDSPSPYAGTEALLSTECIDIFSSESRDD